MGAGQQDEAGVRRYTDADVQRVAKRLQRHRDHLFTFLDKPNAPSDNNLAERAMRPQVFLRKASQSNRSERGAATQSVLMSVFRTLKLRGLDPIRTVADALRTYVRAVVYGINNIFIAFNRDGMAHTIIYKSRCLNPDRFSPMFGY